MGPVPFTCLHTSDVSETQFDLSHAVRPTFSTGLWSRSKKDAPLTVVSVSARGFKLTGVYMVFKDGEESNENISVTDAFANPAVTTNLKVLKVPDDTRLAMLVSLNQSVASHEV